MVIGEENISPKRRARYVDDEASEPIRGFHHTSMSYAPQRTTTSGLMDSIHAPSFHRDEGNLDRSWVLDATDAELECAGTDSARGRGAFNWNR